MAKVAAWYQGHEIEVDERSIITAKFDGVDALTGWSFKAGTKIMPAYSDSSSDWTVFRPITGKIIRDGLTIRELTMMLPGDTPVQVHGLVNTTDYFAGEMVDNWRNPDCPCRVRVDGNFPICAETDWPVGVGSRGGWLISFKYSSDLENLLSPQVAGVIA